MAAVFRVVDEGGEVELLAEGGLVGVGDQLQVVDAGQGGRGWVVVWRGLGVGVPADDLRDARPTLRPAQYTVMSVRSNGSYGQPRVMGRAGGPGSPNSVSCLISDA